MVALGRDEVESADQRSRAGEKVRRGKHLVAPLALKGLPVTVVLVVRDALGPLRRGRIHSSDAQRRLANELARGVCWHAGESDGAGSDGINAAQGMQGGRRAGASSERKLDEGAGGGPINGSSSQSLCGAQCRAS